ncbi:hypothetical protein DQM07_01525 [Lacticaseibacillus paracasei subsp. paracasei]|nr:hypothetical protein DQM07_01525 [Lacticaseibacillus paracasei subsp. paracasei]
MISEVSKRANRRRNLLIRTPSLNAKARPFRLEAAYALLSKRANRRRNLLIRTPSLNGQGPAI